MVISQDYFTEFIEKIQNLDKIGNFSDFKNIFPESIFNYQKQYNKDTTNTFAKGIFEGHLFELYVTNLIIKAANELDIVDWIMPIWCRPNSSGHKKKIQKSLNQMDRDPLGNIIMYREGRAYAEYDSIISICGEICIIEFKHTKYNFSIDEIDARIGKLMISKNVNPVILIIKSDTNFPADFYLRQSQDPRFLLLSLGNFATFIDFFKKHLIQFQLIIEKKDCPKIYHPKQYFVGKIDFNTPLVKIYQDFFNFEVSKNEFWQRNLKNTKLINHVPIGLINRPVLITRYLHKDTTLFQYLSQGVVCFLSLKFIQGAEIQLELIMTKLKGKNKLNRWTLTPEKMHFKKSGLVTPLSFSFYLLKRMIKVSDQFMMDTQLIKMIFDRFYHLTSNTAMFNECNCSKISKEWSQKLIALYSTQMVKNQMKEKKKPRSTT